MAHEHNTANVRTGMLWLVLVFVTGVISGCASAPPIATPTLAPVGVSLRDARWVSLEGHSGYSFTAAILKAPLDGPLPTVVVLHGADGLSDWYLDIAQEIANAGFLVIIGCWQQGESQTVGNARCATAPPQKLWVADPAANSGKELIALARSLPEARRERLALFGLSRGGHGALWAEATGADVTALVLDAPAHRPNIKLPPPTSLDLVDRVAKPTLVLHGTADKVISVGQSKEYEAAAKVLGKPVTTVYFPNIGHVVSAIPESKKEAMERIIGFLHSKLD